MAEVAELTIATTMQNNAVKVRVILYDPDESTFKRAINFLDEGEMLKCMFEHCSKPYERVVMFHHKPSSDEAIIQWQAWQNAKAKAIAEN